MHQIHLLLLTCLYQSISLATHMERDSNMKIKRQLQKEKGKVINNTYRRLLPVSRALYQAQEIAHGNHSCKLLHVSTI